MKVSLIFKRHTTTKENWSTISEKKESLKINVLKILKDFM